MRFEQLWNWLEEHKPDVILEVGTWNGGNGARMMKLADGKKYIGFDVWSGGSEELDKIENNVKKHHTKEDAEKSLAGYDIELIEGNTRETLKAYAKGKEPFVDVALLDGGHSFHTIKSDLLTLLPIVKDSGTIFIDDYYFRCPTENVGAQLVMAEVNVPYTVLPKVDRAKDGSLIKMVKINMMDVPRRTKWDIDKDVQWRFEP